MMVVYLPSLGEITSIKQLGAMTQEKLTKVSLGEELRGGPTRGSHILRTSMGGWVWSMGWSFVALECSMG